MSKSQNLLDISQKNIAGKCDMKCSYNYAYSKSSTVVTNAGSMLTLKYDKTNVHPVTYNGNKYIVDSVILTTRNMYLVQDAAPAMFLAVIHSPVVEGPGMVVLVPVFTGSTNPAGSVIEQIIQGTITHAPTAGSKATLQMEFNLQDIVPNKPFYSITDKSAVRQVGGEVVLFDGQGGIFIKKKAYTDMLRMMFAGNKRINGAISKYIANRGSTDTFLPNAPYYYNKNGPNNGGTQPSGGVGSDDIYIDCKPVNVEEEQKQMKMPGYSTEDSYLKIPTKKQLKELVKNQWFQAFILFLCIVILFFVARMLLRKLKPDVDPVK